MMGLKLICGTNNILLKEFQNHIYADAEIII